MDNCPTLDSWKTTCPIRGRRDFLSNVTLTKAPHCPKHESPITSTLRGIAIDCSDDSAKQKSGSVASPLPTSKEILVNFVNPQKQPALISLTLTGITRDVNGRPVLAR
jgi:hypothetical protein